MVLNLTTLYYNYYMCKKGTIFKIISLIYLLFILNGCVSSKYVNKADVHQNHYREDFYSVYYNPSHNFNLMLGVTDGPYSEAMKKALRHFNVNANTDSLFDQHIIRASVNNLKKYQPILAYDTTIYVRTITTDTTFIYHKAIKHRNYCANEYLYFINGTPVSLISSRKLYTKSWASKYSSDELSAKNPNFIYFSAHTQYYDLKFAQHNLISNSADVQRTKSGKEDNFIKQYVNEDDIYLNQPLKIENLHQVCVDSTGIRFYVLSENKLHLSSIINKCAIKVAALSPLDSIVYFDGNGTFIIKRGCKIQTDKYWRLSAYAKWEPHGNYYGEGGVFYENTTNDQKHKLLIMEYIIQTKIGQFSLIRYWDGGRNGNIRYNPFDVNNHYKIWGSMKSIMNIAKLNTKIHSK